MGDVCARLIRVTGLVQGVGFRPCVYSIATRLNLAGEVYNDARGVCIRLEGPEEVLDVFVDTLRKDAPPLSRIDSIVERSIVPTGDSGFVITASQGGVVQTSIVPDAATCDACIADIFDPNNRRYGYAFTNCTHCGPRYTITRHLPYDRPQTTMSVFQMCPECTIEYGNPLDRRFHAQPNACANCGPKLWATDAKGNIFEGDAIEAAASAIRDGKIVALKGLGGFHLVCDAKNPEALATLRRRKNRSEKPFALMFANIPSIRAVADLSTDEEQILLRPEHPIVLARKNTISQRWQGIADDLADIGVMLPYTPVHWLLLHELAGKPSGLAWTKDTPIHVALVMTSANPSDEPLVKDNDEAYRRLGSIADLFVLHNRDILIGCDDSVVREVGGDLVFVRRARGYTPRSIALASEVPQALALGGYLKNTIALSRGQEVFLSQHIGDLKNRATTQALESAIDHLESILEVEPQFYVCDAHPDFFSTRLARRLAAQNGKPLYTIHHHAAHIGVVMAEAGLDGPTLGLALDGVGLGPGGVVWGGELLLADATGFSRLGHLETLPLAGGDRAAKEPWRMGAAILASIGQPEAIASRWPNEPFAKDFIKLAHNPRLTQRTSSLGRYFDGVASLLGICDRLHDEAYAAMRLESLATTRIGHIIENGFEIAEDGTLSLVPLLRKLVCAEDKAQAAADFHRTLARALAELTAARARRIGYHGIIALTGGCIINRLLAEALTSDLRRIGYEVRMPRTVPAGDGGIALGQLWLAALAHRAGAHTYSFRT